MAKCVTIRVGGLEFLAGLLWVASLALLALDTTDGKLGLCGAWALVGSAAAATVTVVAWSARHVQPTVHAYELGLRQGAELERSGLRTV